MCLYLSDYWYNLNDVYVDNIFVFSPYKLKKLKYI